MNRANKNSHVTTLGDKYAPPLAVDSRVKTKGSASLCQWACAFLCLCIYCRISAGERSYSRWINFHQAVLSSPNLGSKTQTVGVFAFLRSASISFGVHTNEHAKRLIGNTENVMFRWSYLPLSSLKHLAVIEMSVLAFSLSFHADMLNIRVWYMDVLNSTYGRYIEAKTTNNLRILS